MNTHNICFHAEIKKSINTFWFRSTLSGAMNESRYGSVFYVIPGLYSAGITEGIHAATEGNDDHAAVYVGRYIIF